VVEVVEQVGEGDGVVGSEVGEGEVAGEVVGEEGAGVGDVGRGGRGGLESPPPCGLRGVGLGQGGDSVVHGVPPCAG